VNIEFDERVLPKTKMTGSIWSISHNQGRRQTGAEAVRGRDVLDAVDETGLGKRCLQSRTALDDERQYAQVRQPGHRRRQVVILHRLDRDAATPQRFQMSRARESRFGRDDQYDGPGIERREDASRMLEASSPVEQHAGQRARAKHIPSGQQGIIDQHRTGPDGQRIDFSPLALKPPIGGRPGQLHATFGSADKSVG
jgi:hypothetical protein